MKRTWKYHLTLITAIIAAGVGGIIEAPLATAADNCMSGYVPRQSYPGDVVCVTPATHTQALDDNRHAAGRIQPGNNGYGPNACQTGYVWREARETDLVCVTPSTRAQTKYDNSQAMNRRVKVIGRDTAEVFSLVNQERVKAGCGELQRVSRLQTSAAQQSQDQAARDRAGHDGANGSTIDSRLGVLGYSRWAENTAQWQSSQEAVNFWLSSPGHRANMLTCAFKETGLAVATSTSGKRYWTQTFGG